MKLDLAKAMNSAGKLVGGKMKAKSPEILMGVGVITFAGAIFAACKATLEVEEVLKEHKDDMEVIKDEVPTEDLKKETAKVYLHTGVKLVKLYAPAAILATTSLGTMFASNHILRQRNASLAAMYTALDAAYKKYRAAVVDKYGEEEDFRLANGIKDIEVEEKYTDEKGKEKTRKRKASVVDSNSADLYTRYITPAMTHIYQQDDNNMLYWIKCQENWWNDKLARHRRKNPLDNYDVTTLTFNEVLDQMGFETSRLMNMAGWRYDLDNPSGDNYVKINHHKAEMRNEYGELEPVWVLQFNVEGDIVSTEAIDERRRMIKALRG